MNWTNVISGLSDTPTLWFFFCVALILIAMILAIATIISTTRKSLTKTMQQTFSLMKNVSPSDIDGRNHSSVFHTTGIGEVYWEPNSPIRIFTHNFVSANPGVSVDDLYDLVTQKFVDVGVDFRDITTRPITTVTRDGIVYTSVSVAVAIRRKLEEKDTSRLDQAALGAGFRQSRDYQIETISLEDAHEEAGKRAMEDAIANLDYIVTRIGMDNEGIGMTAVHLDTADTPDGDRNKVVKHAKISWVHRKPVEK